MEKRSRKIFTVYLIIAGILLSIVLKIVVFDNKKYLAAATSQHIKATKVKQYRGMIYDKNLIPLVDGRSYILNYSPNGSKDLSKTIKYNITKRYDERNIARHLIGYVNSQNEGVAGLEKKYNQILKTTGSYVINNFNDVHKNEVEWLPKTFKNSQNLSGGIKLTLDYHIQKICEDCFDENKKVGAVVVLDTDNFDVAAMVSRPNFDQNNIENYLNNNGTELINRAISQYNAGSIFKIITAAAALENNISKPDDMFYCQGFKKIGDNVFGCNKKEGHGNISFSDGFSQSCNCCFYDLGIACGHDFLWDMAKRFGLGEKVINFDDEAKGNINMGYTDSDMANASIGQGDILITPLQAAKMTAIIANNGVSKDVNIINSIVDNNGYCINNIKKENEKRIISSQTAKTIKQMMEKAVNEGTGISAKSEKVAICGKTGTAQTGWLNGNELMVHGWFVGFFPKDNPKYAMSIFLENGQSSMIATKMFLEIAEKIVNIN